MAILTTAPRGTQDILPGETHKWQQVERMALETAGLYGFQELRFPTFEHTELFIRSVGETTDVVQKEMYTFTDKGERSLTLRPEGTASTVRSAIEHGLLNDALPLKVCYVTPCFRYEKPQAGRLREFHQFGVEMFGPSGPSADAEIILVATALLKRLGIHDLRTEVNSIGCPECRPQYYRALREYFESHKDRLCETCQGRLWKNPMRILDCKSPICQTLAKDAPNITDFLCPACHEHFEGLKQRLSAAGVNYTINPRIVRGLDYYTRTVFELVSTKLGAQGTVCGGGWYDGLVQELGGNPTPALGFAMGLERLIAQMEKTGCAFEEPKKCDLYLASVGEEAAQKAIALAEQIRAEGFYVECDLMERSVKASMKYAGKTGCAFSMVIGENELEEGKANLKNMKTGGTSLVAFGTELIAALYNGRIDDVLEAFPEAFENAGLKAERHGPLERN